MYIKINNIGEKRIDLSYPIKNSNSSKEDPEGSCSTEITVITMFSDNIQYEVEKAFTT